jgi:phosphoribosylformimino-5-aminoimidazole carboxamide ribotide isomerase
MEIIPAVDIRQGRCVRLLQGREDAETVYSADPAAMALRWQNLGAPRIHVVDLDGAFAKGPKNTAAIEKILATVTVPVQVGGGVRNLATMERLFAMGVGRVIVGTEAHKNPGWVKAACEKYPGRVVIGIDAKGGKVAIEGWTEATGATALELARAYAGLSVGAINFTDIQRDGMRTGVNIEATRELALSTDIPVVASGGVATIEDIKALLPLVKDGVAGVITGKAVYEGTLDLAEAIALARGI